MVRAAQLLYLNQYSISRSDPSVIKKLPLYMKADDCMVYDHYVSLLITFSFLWLQDLEIRPQQQQEVPPLHLHRQQPRSHISSSSCLPASSSAIAGYTARTAARHAGRPLSHRFQGAAGPRLLLHCGALQGHAGALLQLPWCACVAVR